MSQQFGTPKTGSSGSGTDGQDGVDGKSAYEIAVINGFAGTQTEWLLSLKGDDGIDGKSPYEAAITDGFVGTESAWLASLKGEKGDNGDTIIDQRTQQAIKMWTGTQAQYDAVASKDTNTLYVIKL